jgi:rod shape determining protein RodA
MFDERRLQHHIDWPLLTAVLALAGIGLVMIYSATWNPLGGPDKAGAIGPRFWTHLYASAIGVGALFTCLFLDYRRLCENSLFIYLGVAALLIYVLVAGSTQGGAQRWIALGGFNLQPSEFMKLALALALATFFAENNRGAQNYKDLAIAAGIAGLAFLLIYKQPDLGTAVTLLPILFGIAFAAGLRMKLLVILAIVAVISAPVGWMFALKPYQKERIETFLDPEKDARGAGYQQLQARISVGSGGLTGKGFRHGTQGQFRFLPEPHSDFIYSVLGEEQGFLGVLATLGLYLFVVLRTIEVARLAKDRHGTYLVVGLISCFSFQVLYNITMSAGLAPVKGLTLPLMSYGGSSIIATLAAFGLILNVRMRRFTN